MKYNNRNTTETLRAVKIAMRSPEEDGKIFAICMIRNGITEQTIILAMELVSESVVIPQSIYGFKGVKKCNNKLSMDILL